MAPVNAPFLYVAELLHDPRGLSTRFLCAANGYLRAERTAKSLPLQAAELWQRSFCPRQRAHGPEPFASKLSSRNTTKIKCYVPSWFGTHTAALSKCKIKFTCHNRRLKSTCFLCRLQMAVVGSHCDHHKQPIPIVAAFICRKRPQRKANLCYQHFALAMPHFWAAQAYAMCKYCRMLPQNSAAADHLDILKC